MPQLRVAVVPSRRGDLGARVHASWSCRPEPIGEGHGLLRRAVLYEVRGACALGSTLKFGYPMASRSHFVVVGIRLLLMSSALLAVIKDF